jgi:alkylated DNA repair protein (DNA oxidative demethylase)
LLKAALVRLATDELEIFLPENKCRNEKAKNMHMMCLGRVLDMQTRTHSVKIPIPELITALCDRALKAVEGVTDVRPTGVYDQCMVNYYRENARLGLHDEKDSKGAVVSFSVGDSAEFVFKRSWSKKSKLHRVVLRSGDLFVFGGDARSIVHGIERIFPLTTPHYLTLQQPGRINFNVREK